MFLRLLYLLLINVEYGRINARMNDLQLMDRINLSTQVKKYYQASSIFNVYIDKSGDINTLTTVFRLSRALSNNNILVQSLKLNLLPQYARYYKHRAPIPLYVITLESLTDLKEFSNFTRNFTMSLNLWLVLVYRSNELLKYCNRPDKNLFNLDFDTKMLVKCEDDSLIREWYSLHRNEVKVNDIATWTPTEGFVALTHRIIWERRGTLEGLKIRIATVKDSPNAVGNLERDRGTLYGLFGSALQELAEIANFTVELVFSEDIYGNYYPEYNNWTGAIGRVVNREVDIGVAEFGRSNYRLSAVDFTVPLMITRMNLYFRQPNMSVISWSAYTQVFDNRIWTSNWTLLCVSSLVIAIIVKKIGKRQILPLILENCFYIWGIQCQQALPEFPSVVSLKLAFTSLFMSSTVIYMSYSATLTSYLTVFIPSLPFTSEQEFLSSTSYSLIALRGGLYHDLIQLSRDSSTKQLRARLKKTEDLPADMYEAINQMCNEKVVLLTSELFIKKMTSEIPCRSMFITTGSLDSASFILVKRSPYRKIINYYIQKFRSYGIIKVLSRRHLRNTEVIDSKYSPVSFWNIVPILTILISGMLFSILVLTCEKMHYIIKMKRGRARKLKT